MTIKQFSLLDICFMLSLSGVYAWIARDRDGELYAYTVKPSKSGDVWTLVEQGEYFKIDNNFTDGLFLSVNWHDRYPVLIPNKRELIERMFALLGGKNEK